MEFKDKVIYDIQDYIFNNNVKCSRQSNIRLSHIKDQYFCIITHNKGFGFFSKRTPSELNDFYNKVYYMLFSDNHNGMGCFDYERTPKPDYMVTNESNSNILDKVNQYFGDSLNFILIKYSDDDRQPIIPMAFFTYKDNYIWNVCTGIGNRNQGVMTMLMKHFFELYKTKQLNYLKLDLESEGISLFLLRKNPEFDNVKKFYLEQGFKVHRRKQDKYIMKLFSS